LFNLPAEDNYQEIQKKNLFLYRESNEFLFYLKGKLT